MNPDERRDRPAVGPSDAAAPRHTEGGDAVPRRETEEGFDSRSIIERMRQDYWQNLAAPPDDEPKEIRRVIAFDVGPGYYGIAVDCVGEVLKMPWVSRLPRTPEFLLGVVNVRGRILPVVDLRPVLDHPTRPADRDTRLVIVRRGEAEVCFRADRVYGLTEFAAEEMHDTPSIATGGPRELLVGQVEIDNRLMALLDVDALLKHCAESIGGTE